MHSSTPLSGRGLGGSKPFDSSTPPSKARRGACGTVDFGSLATSARSRSLRVCTFASAAVSGVFFDEVCGCGGLFLCSAGVDGVEPSRNTPPDICSDDDALPSTDSFSDDLSAVDICVAGDGTSGDIVGRGGTAVAGAAPASLTAVGTLGTDGVDEDDRVRCDPLPTAVPSDTLDVLAACVPDVVAAGLPVAAVRRGAEAASNDSGVRVNGTFSTRGIFLTPRSSAAAADASRGGVFAREVATACAAVLFPLASVPDATADRAPREDVLDFAPPPKRSSRARALALCTSAASFAGDIVTAVAAAASAAGFALRMRARLLLGPGTAD